MTEPKFSRTMKDGNGDDVTLDLMPRTEFPQFGWQAGVMLTVTRDGEELVRSCIGLSDEDRVAFAHALLNESEPS
jgi:hypothetical protein